jgi:CheY-like chemotaxis protein
MSLFPLSSVLVVHPDPDMREQYALMLADIALDVQRADDGRIALARVLASPPTLLLTEARVPFIDGCALCQVLRSDPATAHLPIVIATTDSVPAGILRARAAGADAVLIKPFATEVFIGAVRQAVAARSEPERDPRAADRYAASPAGALSVAERSASGMKSHAHARYATSVPPRVPPSLRCPHCDRSLSYVNSHIGGVSAAHPEQWDHFDCPDGCGTFDYRHRTRKVTQTA